MSVTINKKSNVVPFDRYARNLCRCGGNARLVLSRNVKKARFGYYHVECEHSCGRRTNRVEVVERSRGGANKPLAKERAVKLWNQFSERDSKWYSCGNCGSFDLLARKPVHPSCCKSPNILEVPENVIFKDVCFEKF